MDTTSSSRQTRKRFRVLHVDNSKLPMFHVGPPLDPGDCLAAGLPLPSHNKGRPAPGGIDSTTLSTTLSSTAWSAADDRSQQPSHKSTKQPSHKSTKQCVIARTHGDRQPAHTKPARLSSEQSSASSRSVHAYAPETCRESLAASRCNEMREPPASALARRLAELRLLPDRTHRVVLPLGRLASSLLFGGLRVRVPSGCNVRR